MKHPLNIYSPPSLVIEGSVPVGVIIGICLSVEFLAIARVAPEVTPPKIAATPSLSTNLLNACIAPSGVAPSSSKINSICLPFIPPASLISFINKDAPSLAELP